MSYLSKEIKTPVPQSEALSGQTENSAGGFSWSIDCWGRLNRFLILGTEGGTYYAGQRKLTTENIDALKECLAEDAIRTINTIVEISTSGRAPKNDPAILAMVVATMQEYVKDEKARSHAYNSITEVCRTGTHIFTFCEISQELRKWSHGLRRGVGAWYVEKSPDKLAYQIIKYRQREGWTHKDVIALSHPRYKNDLDDITKGIIDYAVTGEGTPHPLIGAYTEAQNPETSDTRRVELIKEHKLPREALPTDSLNNNEIWQAMLETGMPIGALIRNLATMTKNELLTTTSDATKIVVDAITNEDAIRNSRIHPIQVLAALKTYESGRGARGNNVWNPVTKIVDALDSAYYLSFGNVEPTGKRRLVALDVSGSMWGGSVAGVIGLSPAVATGAMAAITASTGDPYEVVAFTQDSRSYGYKRGAPPKSLIESKGRYFACGLSSMSLSSRQRLDDIVKVMEKAGEYMGGTDCALPMLYADQENKEFDVFEIYTDSETWAGDIHPAKALQKYRKNSGIDAKLVVVGMVSNGFTIADPNDAGMLDVVGFDTATPNLISEFIK